MSEHPSPPHVLLVTPGFPANEEDTTCLPALQLFVREAHRQAMARYSIVALHYPIQRHPYRWHGIPVFPAGGNNTRGLARLSTWWRGAARMRAVHRVDDPALIHATWLTDAAALATVVGTLLDLPVVLTAMGQDAHGKTPWTKILPLRRATVVVPSARAEESLEAAVGRVPDQVIPWGVEAPTVPLRSWEKRDVDVLGVGSLEPVKNWAAMVRVVATLAATGQCRRAVLVGTGSERQALGDLVSQLGLERHIELLGERPRGEVLALMARSRVLLHPSRFEGLGLVMLEALAHGVSVVSRPVGIAAASERWWIADGEPELTQCVAAALATPRNTTSLRPWPLEETAQAYGDLYRRIALRGR